MCQCVFPPGDGSGQSGAWTTSWSTHSGSAGPTPMKGPWLREQRQKTLVCWSGWSQWLEGKRSTQICFAQRTTQGMTQVIMYQLGIPFSCVLYRPGDGFQSWGFHSGHFDLILIKKECILNPKSFLNNLDFYVSGCSIFRPKKLHVFGHQPTFDNMLSQAPPQKQRLELKTFTPREYVQK